jgi:hypothetical protein
LELLAEPIRQPQDLKKSKAAMQALRLSGLPKGSSVIVDEIVTMTSGETEDRGA